MLLPVPFCPNTGDGNQCYQAAMQSVLLHCLKREASLEELDRLTGREANQWTWTPQIVPILTELGLSVRFCTTQALEPVAEEGADAIRRLYGDQAEHILSVTNIDALQHAAQWILRKKAYEVRDVPFSEVETALLHGHIPMLLLDASVLEERSTSYHGHFVVVTGFDDTCVFYNESGPKNPQPHRRIPKERFIRAWEAAGTDKDIVIISPPTPTSPQ